MTIYSYITSVIKHTNTSATIWWRSAQNQDAGAGKQGSDLATTAVQE